MPLIILNEMLYTYSIKNQTLSDFIYIYRERERESSQVFRNYITVKMTPESKKSRREIESNLDSINMKLQQARL
jgi:hypothetical protein